MSEISAHPVRTVVTGIGVVSPIGCDLESFVDNLVSSDPVTHQGNAPFTGHIRDFGELSPESKRVLRKSLKLMNRETQLGVAAAQHAINQSEINTASYDPDRVGVCFGAGNVEIQPSDFVSGVEACRDALAEFDPKVWGAFGISHVDPLWILRVLPNMPACHAAIANDLRGPNNTITHAGVATNMAIAEARNAILDGDADAMVVGGTGTNLHESFVAGNDTIAAEGAAALVIERYDAAVSRGATVWGEIFATSAATSITHDHRAMPSNAAAIAMKSAIGRSRITTAEITLTNGETANGQAALDELNGVPSICLQRLVGDAAAGTSALEVAALLLSLAAETSTQQAAINISTMPNGLASCVMLGNCLTNSENKVAA